MSTSTFERETRFVELVARHWWRYLRPLVRRHLTPRCRSCVLPASCGGLSEAGLCPECRAPGRQVAAPAARTDPAAVQELDGILRGAQRTGRGLHDALVLFSGGKDSAYLLHRVRRDYPELRLLTLLVNNGFMSPIALANANHILAQFDCDHLEYRLKRSFVRKVFRHALTHLEQQRGYSIVDLMDGYLTFDAGRRIARQLGIPLVIAGLSRVQVATAWGLEEGFEYPVEWLTRTPTQYAGLLLSEMTDADEMGYWWDGRDLPRAEIPRFLFPLCAWDPDETLILAEVVRLGLIEPRRSSPLLTNNRLIPVIAMAEIARFGYSSFEVEFAAMVRAGRSERRHWLNLFEMAEYSAKTGRFIGRTTRETLDELGLSKQELGIPHG